MEYLLLYTYIAWAFQLNYHTTYLGLCYCSLLSVEIILKPTNHHAMRSPSKAATGASAFTQAIEGRLEPAIWMRTFT